MRGDTHAGCGERSGETGPWQHRHRAPDRLNGVIVCTCARSTARLNHPVESELGRFRYAPPRAGNSRSLAERPSHRAASRDSTDAAAGTVRFSLSFVCPTSKSCPTRTALRCTEIRRFRNSISATVNAIASPHRKPVNARVSTRSA